MMVNIMMSDVTTDATSNPIMTDIDVNKAMHCAIDNGDAKAIALCVYVYDDTHKCTATNQANTMALPTQ